MLVGRVIWVGKDDEERVAERSGRLFKGDAMLLDVGAALSSSHSNFKARLCPALGTDKCKSAVSFRGSAVGLTPTP